MSELYESTAWRAARQEIADHGLPPVPQAQFDDFLGFLHAVQPDIEADISYLSGLPKPRIRYRLANEFSGYLQERFLAFAPEKWNGPGAQEFGRSIADETIGNPGVYAAGPAKVWIFLPNLFATAGSDPEHRKAVGYQVSAHETTHGALYQGIPWLVPYTATLSELKKPISESRRAELRGEFSPLIPPEAYESPEVARQLFDVVTRKNEGFSETMSWGALDRGVDRGHITRWASRVALYRRLSDLRGSDLMKIYGAGVVDSGDAITLGRPGITAYWKHPGDAWRSGFVPSRGGGSKVSR